MDITNIATPDYVEVRADKRLGKIRSIFDRERPNGIIVTKVGGYTGVVGEKQLVRSRMGDDTKVDVVTKSAPKLDRHEDIREAARMLVEGDVNVAPVFEGNQLYGIVTGEDILEAVLENLDAISVEDIFTDDVVDVAEQSPLGEAINKLREHSISRVPVVEQDESSSLTGILTTHDIIDFVVRDDDRQGRGDRSGDLDRMLDLPVYDLMSAPVITAQPNEPVSDAVKRMFDNDISGVVVTPAAGDTTIEGVLTKTDVLRALTFTEEDRWMFKSRTLDYLKRSPEQRLLNQLLLLWISISRCKSFMRMSGCMNIKRNFEERHSCSVRFDFERVLDKLQGAVKDMVLKTHSMLHLTNLNGMCLK
jgi:Predicted transcriptional regulator, contains C-terminal CBS domains